MEFDLESKKGWSTLEFRVLIWQSCPQGYANHEVKKFNRLVSYLVLMLEFKGGLRNTSAGPVAGGSAKNKGVKV
jgi:hypothetical protein